MIIAKKFNKKNYLDLIDCANSFGLVFLTTYCIIRLLDLEFIFGFESVFLELGLMIL